MDEGAKRRLVGAAVVVALIVIFVPMLLEQSDPVGLGEPIVIPGEPSIGPSDQLADDGDADLATPLTAEDLTPPLPIPEPPPGAVVEAPATGPATGIVVEPAPPESGTPELAPAEPEADLVPEGPRPVPAGTISWVVQVASLGSPDAAKGLRDKLRAKGYTAFVEQATVNDKQYYRVRVGPEVERTRADRLAAELQRETSSTPLVQRYP